ncbi:MAG: ABC transporter ATP-binding protein [Actinomycetota bacterium]|nr:ABC transporter ATP-binding protein [Actinomycetota bacterium]
MPPGVSNPSKTHEETAPLARLENITKRFPGVVANDSVDLELKSGEVHALVGENGAGKSTLMRVLYGLYPPDAGRIFVRGKEVSMDSPRTAISHGIGMVHQHFVLVDRFTATENIILGAEGGPLLDMDAATNKVQELAETYGFKVDSSKRVEDLSVGAEQRVEILKSLYRGVDLLILDEPTAVLTPAEARELFQNLRKLADDGKCIVFISHKLDEVLEVADRITVLRRGAVVGETVPTDTSKEKLAEMMVGRPVLFRLDKDKSEAGEPVLEVSSLSIAGVLHDVDLAVHAGEIVGVAGVEGNGQRELAEALVGLRTVTGGSIKLNGNDITNLDCAECRKEGVAFVPEDRQERGLILDMTLWENSVLGRQSSRDYSSGFGVLFIAKIKELAARLIKNFDVRARNATVDARTLSGGNQQKLILARELEGDPALVIAHQPTRGLDVGAIEFVWTRLLEQRSRGRSVLLISAELDEIFALSDRIVTLYEGRVTGEFPPDTPPEELGLAMTGHREKAAG